MWAGRSASPFYGAMPARTIIAAMSKQNLCLSLEHHRKALNGISCYIFFLRWICLFDVVMVHGHSVVVCVVLT